MADNGELDTATQMLTSGIGLMSEAQHGPQHVAAAAGVDYAAHPFEGTVDDIKDIAHHDAQGAGTVTNDRVYSDLMSPEAVTAPRAAAEREQHYAASGTGAGDNEAAAMHVVGPELAEEAAQPEAAAEPEEPLMTVCARLAPVACPVLLPLPHCLPYEISGCRRTKFMLCWQKKQCLTLRLQP